MKQNKDKLAWYIQILLKGSKKFNSALKDFREHRLSLAGDDLKKELDTLLAAFFISPTKESHALLLRLLHGNDPASPYTIHIDHLANEEKPGTFKFQEPSVIVQIKGRIRSEEEWGKIFKEIQKKETELNKLIGIKIIKELPKLKPYRESSNIDFDLELYRLHNEQNYSPLRMQKDQASIKHASGNNNKTIYTKEELKKRLEEITDLLKEA
jgi:hypothetical protein